MKSNGIRLDSLKIKMNTIIIRKYFIMKKFWIFIFISSKFNLEEINDKEININNNPISYEINWEINRFELIILNLFNEKNLLQKIEKLGKPKNNIRINILLEKKLFSIFKGKKIIIIIKKKKLNNGEIFQ